MPEIWRIAGAKRDTFGIEKKKVSLVPGEARHIETTNSIDGAAQEETGKGLVKGREGNQTYPEAQYQEGIYIGELAKRGKSIELEQKTTEIEDRTINLGTGPAHISTGIDAALYRLGWGGGGGGGGSVLERSRAHQPLQIERGFGERPRRNRQRSINSVEGPKPGTKERMGRIWDGGGDARARLHSHGRGRGVI